VCVYKQYYLFYMKADLYQASHCVALIGFVNITIQYMLLLQPVLL